MKFLISAELSSCNISVRKRECNTVAHTLAACGCNFPSGACTIWDGVPRDFEGVVTSDLAGVMKYSVQKKGADKMLLC